MINKSNKEMSGRMKKKLPVIIAFLIAIAAIVGTVVFLVTKFSDDRENDTELTEKENDTNVADFEGDKKDEPGENDGSDGLGNSEKENETTDDQNVKYEDYNGTEVIVVSSEKVEESKNNKTTEDVKNELKDRGFESLQITSKYNIKGDFVSEFNQNKDTEELHPTYDMVYNSDKGDQWFIYCYGGQFFAFPISYNQNSGRDEYLIISEKDSIMSYDCMSNTYNEIIPQKTDLIIRKVDRIDKNTLDSLTSEVLNEND